MSNNRKRALLHVVYCIVSNLDPKSTIKPHAMKYRYDINRFQVDVSLYPNTKFDVFTTIFQDEIREYFNLNIPTVGLIEGVIDDIRLMVTKIDENSLSISIR